MTRKTGPSRFYRISAHGGIEFVDAELDEIQARLEPSDSLAILADDEVLMKHGDARRIQAKADDLRRKMVARGDSDLAAGYRIIEIPVASITAEMLDEINACLAGSGRVDRLEESLIRIMDDSLSP